MAFFMFFAVLQVVLPQKKLIIGICFCSENFWTQNSFSKKQTDVSLNKNRHQWGLFF